MQGWGVDSGDLLIIPGTDVRWGDAVNTAGKLGQVRDSLGLSRGLGLSHHARRPLVQDLADENSILITPKVRDACRGDGSLMQLQMPGRPARWEGCEVSLGGHCFEPLHDPQTDRPSLTPFVPQSLTAPPEKCR